MEQHTGNQMLLNNNFCLQFLAHRWCHYYATAKSLNGVKYISPKVSFLYLLINFSITVKCWCHGHDTDQERRTWSKKTNKHIFSNSSTIDTYFLHTLLKWGLRTVPTHRIAWQLYYSMLYILVCGNYSI